MSEESTQTTPWLKVHILGLAAGLSFMGSTLTTFAVVLRDKDQAGPVGVSIIFLAMMIPNILLAPFAGQIADRFASRIVIPTALGLMSLSTISIAFVAAHWWAPIALFLTASFGTAVGASNSATIAKMVNPADITRVQGISQTYVSLGSLMGPAIGGLLVAATGFFWPFIIDSVSFLILAATFLAIGFNRIPQAHADGEKPRAMDGVKFVMGNRLIRSVVLLLAVVILAVGAVGVGEVFLIVDELDGDAFIYGLVGASLAAGSIVGSILVQVIKVPPHLNPRFVVIAISIMVLALTALSLAPHWGFALVITFIGGFGNSGVNAFAVGIVLRKTDEQMRGRVMAAVMGLVTTGNVLANAAGGVLIAVFGVREVLFTGGMLALIALLVFGPTVLKAGKADAVDK